ncbi:MAG TPA: hypothetical protein VNJ01_09445 [Bacteriovoracaceae bacterium]|nr:hypothetical protein [Bacteriovoracaceae bacterium]
MKILALSLLSILISCGDDVGSNRRLPTLENNRPDITANSPSVLRSSIHRENGSAVLTYADEISRTLAQNLPPVAYRAIPDKEKDDEGTDGRNVFYRTSVSKKLVACGALKTYTGIDARLKECASINLESALWNGQVYGASGEGNWSLVIYTEDKKEIWMDNSTGMVWTDIALKGNWCEASGNDQADTTTSRVDCNKMGEGKSLCDVIHGDTTGAQIRWRLPTRNDLLQADLNGMRFVLEAKNSTGFWTSTITAKVTGRTQAWVYHPADGTLSGQALSSEQSIRCLGVPQLK